MSAEIKSFVTPLRLYRYRSIATENAFNRELEAIVTGYIHCADYKSLNDPMEGVFEASRLLLKSKSYDSIREAVAENKGQIGISSFSEVHDPGDSARIETVAERNHSGLIAAKTELVLTWGGFRPSASVKRDVPPVAGQEIQRIVKCLRHIALIPTLRLMYVS